MSAPRTNEHGTPLQALTRPFFLTAFILAAALCLHAVAAYAALSPIESAEKAFVAAKYDLAEKGFQEVLKNPFSGSSELASARCRMGVIHSIRGNFAGSRDFLEASVKSGALPKAQNPLCVYALLQVLVLQEANHEARELVRSNPEPVLSGVYIARFWALAAEVGKRLPDARFEVVALQRLAKAMDAQKLAAVELKILGDRSVARTEVNERLGGESVRKPVATDSKGIVQPGALSRYLEDGDDDARMAAAAGGARIGENPPAPLESSLSSPGAIAFPAGRSAADSHQVLVLLRRGQYPEALALLPQQPLAIDFANRLRRLGSDVAREMRVGLLLPVGPAFVRFNHRVLRAIAAFQNSPAVEKVIYSFHVQGCLPDPGSMESCAAKLLQEQAVHAIVGPLSASQAFGATAIADALGAPIFALGPVPHVPELSSRFLVRLGNLARSQVDPLIAHMQEQQLKNFAIFAPWDAYGYEMATAAAKAAKARGLPLVKTTFFSPDAEVLQAPVEQAVGPQTNEMREKAYVDLIKAAKKKAEDEKRKFDLSLVKFPAVLNFDALFVPEALPRARLIASTFAFLEAKNLRLAGDKQWAESLVPGGRASITNQFLLGSRVPTLVSGQFLPQLQRDLGVNLPVANLDLERQAFDAGIFLRQAQYAASGNNGAKLAQAWINPGWQVDGVAKYQSVDETGEPQAKVLLSSFQGNALSPELGPWPVNTPTPMPTVSE